VRPWAVIISENEPPQQIAGQTVPEQLSGINDSLRHCSL
jgi:hypothetical protein